jgi:hypothetical protein
MKKKVVALMGEFRINVVIDSLRRLPGIGLTHDEITEVLENLERKGVVTVSRDLGLVHLTKP